MTHRRFKDVIDKMPNYMQQLGSCQVITIDGRGRFSHPHELPADNKGIYVFYECHQPMYVGRSDRLRVEFKSMGDQAAKLMMHTSPSTLPRRNNSGHHTAIPNPCPEKH